MKTLTLIFTAIAMMAITTTAKAQWQTSSTTQNMAATIVIPINIASSHNLIFGTMTSPSTASTLTINPSVVGFQASSGLTSFGGEHWGVLNVSGQANRAYTLTLPSQPVELSNGAGGTMTVTGFTAFFENGSGVGLNGTLNGSGSEGVRIGATLNIGANQSNGAYTGSYTATAIY